MADLSKKFVSETDIEEQKKKRQEDWEKVRKPDQPEEVPEEKYDPRTLFDKLQEQKMKKDAEFEEAHKLKNQFRGLEEDETNFLSYVSDRQRDIQRAKKAEEEDMLNEYRNSVVNKTTAVKELPKVSSVERKALPRPAVKSSQQKLLAGAIKRKCPASGDSSSVVADDSSSSSSSSKSKKSKTAKEGITVPSAPGDLPNRGHAVVIGKLPGLGNYIGSSDETSDSNSDVSDDNLDFFNKRVQCHS